MTEKNTSTPIADAAAAAIDTAKSSSVVAITQKPVTTAPAVTTVPAVTPPPAVPIEDGKANNSTLVLPVYGRSADLAKRGPADAALKPPAEVDSTLVRILQARRGHDSDGELAFHSWLLTEVHTRVRGKKGAEVLVAKNSKGTTAAFCVKIKMAKNAKSTTMFSCHIDTVDRSMKARQLEKQAVCYDPVRGHIFLDKTQPLWQQGDCLGADDGAGVWLMLQMISRGKPGTYMFHRGEEKGCIGSNMVLATYPDFLKEHEIAVAFDRPDDNEIITHQGNSRCASDTCAIALREELNKHPGMAYKLSDKGLYTDTKVYREVIPECFNLGVGYYNQHTTAEHLNYGHLTRMLHAIMETNFDALPVDRDPKAVPPPAPRPAYDGWKNHSRYNGNYGHYGREVLDEDYDDNVLGAQFGGAAATPAAPAASTTLTKDQKAAAKKQVGGNAIRVGVDDILTELDGLSIDEIRLFVTENSDYAGTLIAELFSELMAARARIETYRNLIGLNDA